MAAIQFFRQEAGRTVLLHLAPEKLDARNCLQSLRSRFLAKRLRRNTGSDV
jgi:hypothetical protein